MSEETVRKIVSKLETLTTKASISESDLDHVLDDHFKNLLREVTKK